MCVRVCVCVYIWVLIERGFVSEWMTPEDFYKLVKTETQVIAAMSETLLVEQGVCIWFVKLEIQDKLKKINNLYKK